MYVNRAVTSNRHGSLKGTRFVPRATIGITSDASAFSSLKSFMISAAFFAARMSSEKNFSS